MLNVALAVSLALAAWTGGLGFGLAATAATNQALFQS